MNTRAVYRSMGASRIGATTLPLGDALRLNRVVIGSVVGLALVGGGGSATALQVRKNIQEQQGVEQFASLCRDINREIHDNGATVTVGSGSHAVTVLGDSYAAADFLGRTSDGWVAQLGKANGWTVKVNAIRGTGFINGGPCGTQQFSTRIDDVLASKPRTVIVEGGLNDHGKPPAAISGAVSYLLEELKTVPEVIVVGPTDAPAINDEADVDRAMKAAVESNGRTYVSAYKWELPFLPDGTHLTVEGHASYAKQLGVALPAVAR